MAKAKASVSLQLPQAGAEDVSDALALGGATQVVLSVPNFAVAPQKKVHLSLQAKRSGGAWYGVPKSGRRAGLGDAVSEVIELPAGFEAVRLHAFTEVEAAKDGELKAEAKLTVV